MDQFTNRRFVLGLIVIIVAFIILIKLFILQVVNTDYISTAQKNSTKRIVKYPARGLVFDRNGELMVFNQSAYDLMFTPYMVESFDTNEFIDILNISKAELINRLKQAGSTPFLSTVFLKQMSSETYAVLQEKLYKFHGFYVQGRTLRKYSKKIASHLLGYVGEVDQEMVKDNEYYEMGDYIGINGIEKAYEEQLRGEKGEEIYQVDVHNRIQGSYQEGKHDKEPVVGTNISITIDMNLQAYGEKLMQNKRGSMVAIEPSTGEILVMISSPTYDPELLVGRKRSRNFALLQLDTLNPLFNRSIMAHYRPGSTFKLVNGAIALQENILNKNTLYQTYGAFHAGSVVVGCHNYRSPLNVMQAIQYSSNNFFCQAFRNTLDSKKFDTFKEAYNTWRNHVLSFGFGSKLGIELPNEKSGFVPPEEYYNRYYGNNGWKSLTIISMAIGEGELGITPLQMANMGAVIANHGFYYKPHVIKKIGDREMSTKYDEKKFSTIDSSVFKIIVDGMDLVVNGGPGSTAGWVGLSEVVICGKTGTAQNKDKNDHSVFLGFAPKENPEIVVAIYLEYGGWGGSWAAPMASLLMEKYLTGKVKRTWIEDRIVNANLLSVEKKD